MTMTSLFMAEISDIIDVVLVVIVVGGCLMQMISLNSLALRASEISR